MNETVEHEDQVDDDTDYLIEVMAYEALAKLATPAK